ncbi:Mu-like prophage protein gp16 [Acetobacter estunensis NRIC 0472]|uniref:DUF1018 domain-containing protein n=2 Tax=Acetobacter estunensis TaxID=104097 RepID=A0A967B9A0_9PROT|nr:DUF1018 domain-containing protein [Acetobacter estunensis]GBQ27185.1 Mu-like prophage protein gp16 [Acetobacter estunensis NRIC 0472]
MARPVTRLESTTMRRSLIAKIHVARKDLRLEDADYRALLSRVTGRASSADCTTAQLDAILAEMKRLGFRPRPARRSPARPLVRKLYAIWNDMGAVLTAAGSRESLRAFVARQTGVDAPEFLDDAQAVQVIEALKAWSQRIGGGAR